MDVQTWGARLPPSSPEDNPASAKIGPLLPEPGVPRVNPQSELPSWICRKGWGPWGQPRSAIDSGRLVPGPVSEPALDQTCLYSLDKVTYCF